MLEGNLPVRVGTESGTKGLFTTIADDAVPMTERASLPFLFVVCGPAIYQLTSSNGRQAKKLCCEGIAHREIRVTAVHEPEPSQIEVTQLIVH